MGASSDWAEQNGGIEKPDPLLLGSAPYHCDTAVFSYVIKSAKTEDLNRGERSFKPLWGHQFEDSIEPVFAFEKLQGFFSLSLSLRLSSHCFPLSNESC